MEASEHSLVTPGVYQVHSSDISPQVTVSVKNECASSGSLVNCKIINTENRCKRKVIGESASHTVQVNSAIQLNDFVPVPTNRDEQSSVVIGDNVEGCVMVDLHGNVVKDNDTVQAQSAPYIIDEQVIVQVSNEDHRLQAHTSRSGDVVSVYVKSNQDSGCLSVSDKETVRVSRSRGNSLEHSIDGPSSHLKPGLLESRFVFQELSRDEYPTISVPQGTQKENLEVKLEREEGDMQLSKRKSARKARMRWRNLDEDDNVIRKINFLKKRKHYPLAPNDKGKIISDLKIELPLPDVPLWAKDLTSVRVVDGNWIYGIATSKIILHQTLEGHSRSVLCDYIKSHPCNFEKRRNARSQECRIMWQHKRVIFDGIPFSIVSSDDLKCIFGMNYKAKKKNSNKVPDLGVKEYACDENGLQAAESEEVQEKTKASNETVAPKKVYKDVMFSSCPARITVKLIVKFPGYAVHPLSFPAERKVRLKALRTNLSKKLAVEKEELYYVTLPLKSVHNHPFTGRSRNIHPSIISKVKELVEDGITAPKAIKRRLDAHVQMEHGQDIVPPHPEDRAYYPKVKDIGNLVYNYCKKMGIPSKRKIGVGQPAEVASEKKKRLRSSPSGDNEECSDPGIANNLPLQATTLQEAVQTCTEESDRGNAGVEEPECTSVNTVMQSTHNDVANLAEMVRGQLDSLRNITYTLNEPGSLQDLYQSLQGLLNQYAPVSQHILQGNLGSSTAPTAAFIIHESVIDPLSVDEDPLNVATVPESIQSTLTVPGRDVSGVVATAKFRNAQVMENTHVRQIKPSPVALQCLTTNVVPTLSMSQLPRSSNQSSEQGSAHLVTSLPSHSSSNPATVSITHPTYQTVAPVAHDASAVPLQLSLPPYFYYVHEVAVPEVSSASSSLNAR